MGLRESYLAAMQSRCAVAPPIPVQHATRAANDATRRATTAQQGAGLPGASGATLDATTVQPMPLTHATRARHAAEVATFESRRMRITRLGYGSMADHLAEKLLHRDRDIDDRRLCVECEFACLAWRCAKREAFMLEQLQRCPAFRETTT